MVMSVEDRIAKASAARSRSARRKRFRRYTEEMQTHPQDVPAELMQLVAGLLHKEPTRAQGFYVLKARPVDERERMATTQPAER